MLENIKRKSLFPKSPLEGKRNFEHHFRMLPDGTVEESIFLKITDKRMRENIIFTHFLVDFSKYQANAKTDFKVIARDDPWDFVVVVDNSYVMNVEITSISDNTDQFINHSYSDRFYEIRGRETISRSEVQKLSKIFWPTETSASTPRPSLDGGDRDEQIPNPWYCEPTRNGDPNYIYITKSSQPYPDLFSQIESAIHSKSSKNHPNKDKTILVVDNRSMAFDYDDFVEASKRFSELSSTCELAQVWFYSGFYSDDDGSNAGFALAPIIVPTTVLTNRSAALQSSGIGPDGNGISWT